MDGVHLNGNCRFGRIANLKGATNDDMVALNADDGGSGEMCRGPIEDVAVDGLFCEHGYTAIRLLSAGSPVRRIHISNIFGSYRFNVVSFTNHQVHPGSPSVFDDISIRGVFCSKSSDRMSIDPRKPGSGYLAMFWIDAPAVVSSLSVSDLHRTETTWAAETIAIERGATVESLQMSDISLINRTEAPIDLLTNRGAIGALSMTNVYAKAENTASQGAAVRNSGTIRESTLQAVHAVNVSPEIVK
jgi:hypothetical protein